MIIKAVSRARCILYLRDEGMRMFDEGKIKLVSIRDSNITTPIYPDGPNVLNLSFDDIEPVRPGLEDVYLSQGQLIFNDHHKKMIDDFLSEIDFKTTQLLINCHAGVSRSGAVAVYLGLLINGNLKRLTADNPNINPNRWVLEKLGVLAEWESQINIEASSIYDCPQDGLFESVRNYFFPSKNKTTE